MTPIEELFSKLVKMDIWVMAKVFVLFVLGLYLVFASLIIREVDLMNRTLKGVGNLPIKIVAWIHLIFAIFIFLVALITL